MFVVHIVQSNPHQWSSFAPMKLNHTSFVVISTGLPVYRPFALITRFLTPTSDVRSGGAVPQQMILSSLRSPAVVCCTQGSKLHQAPLQLTDLILPPISCSAAALGASGQ